MHCRIINLNTSHVILYRYDPDIIDNMYPDLNTSHVILYLQYRKLWLYD